MIDELLVVLLVLVIVLGLVLLGFWLEPKTR
jgi:hypothetical protein